MTDQQKITQILDEKYEGYLIKLSKMVEAGKISEGNARIIFRDYRAWYTRLLKRIEGLGVV